MPVLRRLTGVPVLMYHCLGAPPDASRAHWYVDAQGFADQLTLLHQEGFSTIELRTLLAALDSNTPPSSQNVVLTFDDGHRSFCEIGLPLLREHGFRATMFLITSKIGRKDYMDWGEIRGAQEVGMSFQSHTVSHPILTRIPPEEARREIEDSKVILEQGLGRPVHAFAYRGGHYNEVIQRLVREAGYDCAVSTQPGVNSPGVDRYALKRTSVRNYHRGARFLERLYQKSKGGLLSRLSHWVARG